MDQAPDRARGAAPRKRHRYLVIGADSFVGQQLVAALQKLDGVDVIATIRPSARQFAETFDAVGSSGDAPVDAIINCTMGAPSRIVAAARIIARGMRSEPRCRIVQLSSMAVYGEATGLVSEQARIVPARLAAYGAAQYTAEQIVESLGAVVLRPGCEYGPGCVAWGDRIGRWLQAGRIGHLGSGGYGSCNLVYVDDLVTALIAAARMPALEGAIFNIAMAGSPTWNGYFRAFAAMLDVPLVTVDPARLRRETQWYAVPLKLVELVARPLRLDPQQRLPEAIPPSFVKLCARDQALNVKAAEQRLGLTWTPLDEGLRAAVRALWAGTALP